MPAAKPPVEKPVAPPAPPAPAEKPAEKPAAPAAAPAPAEKPAPKPADKPAEKKKEVSPFDDPFAQNPSGLRTWSDASGKYRVEARFIERLSDGTIRLQRADGRYVRVAFDRLSLADRQFVQQQNKALAMQ